MHLGPGADSRLGAFRRMERGGLRGEASGGPGAARCGVVSSCGSRAGAALPSPPEQASVCEVSPSGDALALRRLAGSDSLRK
jgi:hypothetical protein